MNRSRLGIGNLIGALFIFAPFSVVADAREVTPALTTEQVRASFVRNGYATDSPIYWQSSGLTTFFVQDAPERVLLVLVYPDIARAEEEHRMAHAQEEAELGTPIAFSDEHGPELMPGYGRSSWWHNVALVQANPRATDEVQVDRVRTGASRRTELKVLRSVDPDLVVALRGAGADETWPPGA
jgi:hypothetical protein